jgi:hypothetical protein
VNLNFEGRSDRLKSSARATPPQAHEPNAAAFLALKLNGYAGGFSEVFYGVGYVLIGILVARSGYLPRWLGFLLAISGIGFVVRSFMLVLAPAVPSSTLLMLTAAAGLALIVWLLIRGVDVAIWEAKLGRAGSAGPP